MLIVVAGTSFGIPAPIATWRAGFCPSPAVQDAAEHDLVDLLAGDLGPLERGAHSLRAELGGRDVLELPAEAAHRRPHRADDHSIFHHSLLGQVVTPTVPLRSSIRPIVGFAAGRNQPGQSATADGSPWKTLTQGGW